MRRFAVRLVLASCVSLLFAGTTLAAKTFSKADAEQLHAIAEQLIIAGRDITQSLKLMPPEDRAARCLEGVHDSTISVTSSIIEVWRLLTLAASMRDPDDERLAIAAIADALKPTTLALSRSREEINGWMGICSSSPVVNAKGQTVIGLFSETVAALVPVTAKIREVLARPL
jgi:hypothetical protein